MSYYDINWNSETETLTVGFGSIKAGNDKIVQEAAQKIQNLRPLVMGAVIKINGPISAPAAFAIATALHNVARAIAVYDPKIERGLDKEGKPVVGGYIVSSSFSSNFQIGDVID